MADLAKRIIALTDSRSSIVFLPLPADDPKQRQPDIRLARELLDWNPAVGIDDGLRRTIEYFRGR
jgi:UDP-glucuronate decarboxylase